jgi:hypothetical protein
MHTKLQTLNVFALKIVLNPFPASGRYDRLGPIPEYLVWGVRGAEWKDADFGTTPWAGPSGRIVIWGGVGVGEKSRQCGRGLVMRLYETAFNFELQWYQQ